MCFPFCVHAFHRVAAAGHPGGFGCSSVTDNYLRAAGELSSSADAIHPGDDAIAVTWHSL
jgi:hypothetical protein